MRSQAPFPQARRGRVSGKEDEDAGGHKVPLWDVLFRVLRSRESDLVKEMGTGKDGRGGGRGLHPLLLLPLQRRRRHGLPHQN